jgi:hypothetical protein
LQGQTASKTVCVWTNNSKTSQYGDKYTGNNKSLRLKPVPFRHHQSYRLYTALQSGPQHRNTRTRQKYHLLSIIDQSAGYRNRGPSSEKQKKNQYFSSIEAKIHLNLILFFFFVPGCPSSISYCTSYKLPWSILDKYYMLHPLDKYTKDSKLFRSNPLFK